MKKLLLPLLLLPQLALAQTNPPTNSPGPNAKPPIEIDAAGSLIWRQADKTYHAVGDASATRGDLNVKADELTAHYIDVKGSSNQIQTMDADGHVIITDDGNIGVGPHAHDDLTTGDLVLTGTGLKLTNADGDTMTAQQQIQFNDQTGKAFGIGQPFITHLDRTLAGTRMDGQFVKDAQGNWNLQTATATGNVVVVTGIGGPNPSVATADHGFYDAVKNTALLTSNVKLTRGKNQMNGDRAEIDMNTGESRMLPSLSPASPDHRVRAILYQGDNTNAAKPKSSTPTAAKATP